MGTIFDYFGEASWTESKSVSDIQYKNRQLLKDIMEKHGFLNFKKNGGISRSRMSLLKINILILI